MDDVAGFERIGGSAVLCPDCDDGAAGGQVLVGRDKTGAGWKDVNQTGDNQQSARTVPRYGQHRVRNARCNCIDY